MFMAVVNWFAWAERDKQGRLIPLESDSDSYGLRAGWLLLEVGSVSFPVSETKAIISPTYTRGIHSRSF